MILNLSYYSDFYINLKRLQTLINKIKQDQMGNGCMGTKDNVPYSQNIANSKANFKKKKNTSDHMQIAESNIDNTGTSAYNKTSQFSKSGNLINTQKGKSDFQHKKQVMPGSNAKSLLNPEILNQNKGNAKAKKQSESQHLNQSNNRSSSIIRLSVNPAKNIQTQNSMVKIEKGYNQTGQTMTLIQEIKAQRSQIQIWQNEFRITQNNVSNQQSASRASYIESVRNQDKKKYQHNSGEIEENNNFENKGAQQKQQNQQNQISNIKKQSYIVQEQPIKKVYTMEQFQAQRKMKRKIIKIDTSQSHISNYCQTQNPCANLIKSWFN